MARRLAPIVATALLALAAAGAAPAGGQPFRVALVGDSIVEGSGAESPTGLGTALRVALLERGYASQGLGYVAAHGASVVPREGTVEATPWVYTGRWVFGGLSPFFSSDRVLFTRSAPFGAQGYVSETDVAGSLAEARLPGDAFGVTYVRAPDGGRFAFSVDGARTVVDARTAGPLRDAIVWLQVSPFAPSHRVAVTALGGGRVRFTGVVARSERPVSLVRVEISQLGHAGADAAENLTGPQRAELDLLHPDLTMLMFGTNDEAEYLATGDDTVRARFVASLTLRGRLARRHGGACVIVPPVHNPHPDAVQADFRALARSAARVSGCRYAPVLDGAWPTGGPVAAAMTSDGIHPTAAGYRRMAARLARLVVAYARA